jgi:hypothetical protein
MKFGNPEKRRFQASREICTFDSSACTTTKQKPLLTLSRPTTAKCAKRFLARAKVSRLVRYQLATVAGIMKIPTSTNPLEITMIVLRQIKGLVVIAKDLNKKTAK